MTFSGGVTLNGGISIIGSSGGGGSDPFFANVSLLTHFDGTSGQTVFTDNSPRPKTITNVNGFNEGAGNVNVDTTVLKFGTGSAFFPNFQQLRVSDSNDDLVLGAGDFTIEAWFRIPSVGSGDYSVASTMRNNNFSVGGCWAVTVRSDGSLQWRVNTAGNGPSPIVETSTGIINSNTWYSFAVTRSSGTVRLFLDGNIVSTALNYNVSLNVDQTLKIGALFNNTTEQFSNGNIDELRITKGVARYTSNYTPATSAFPDN